MSLTLAELRNLPSPFYRVAVKALTFDEEGRVLVVLNKEGHYEIPGGGWEHEENLEECIRRELREEVGAQAKEIGPIDLVFQGKSKHGWRVIRVVVRVQLKSYVLKPSDDMVAAKFVTKAEFLELDFDITDRDFKKHISQIWR